MRKVQQKLSVARGERPAELLFKNARVVNVFSGEIHETNVAVEDGRIVGFGDYQARQVINLRGAYLAGKLVASGKRVARRNFFTGIKRAECLLFVPSLLPLGFDQVKRILSATARHRARDDAETETPGQWQSCRALR